MTDDGALKSAEVERFHAEAARAYSMAAERQGRYLLATEIAGVRIDIETAGPRVMEAIRPALFGISADLTKPAQARILVFDTRSSDVAAPEFGRPIQHLIRWRGDCWTDADARCRVVFHMSDYTLQVFDPDAATCVVMIAGVEKLPSWTLAAPLRSPLAMILETHGVYLVHGAAVGYSDGAALITGYGGSGKSTTTMSCHKAGMPILGDDYVALRPSCEPGQPPTMHNVFSSLKLVPQETGDAQDSARVQDKRILYPFAEGQGGLLREAPLRAAILAQITDIPESRIVSASAQEVARIAFASSALQIPMACETDVADAILESVQCAGAYRIQLGRDRSSAFRSLEHFLKEETPASPSIAPRVPWMQLGSMKPVSLIIPVHNGSAFIAEAIASAVAQDYHELEIIVVDDGSTDDLQAALEQVKRPFDLIKQPQRGPAAARNKGLQTAQHEWIAFLDADDLWPHGALLTLARDLALHRRAGVVRGGAITFLKDPETGKHVNAFHPRENYPFYIGGGLYRRSVFDTVGPFDETLTYAEDTDWYWRAAETDVQVINIPETVLHVRMHSTNMTSDHAAAERGAIQAVKRRLQRSREGKYKTASLLSRTPSGAPFLKGPQ